MENDSSKPQKGTLEHRPLLIFVWAVLPIIAIFGVTIMSPTASSTELIANQSLIGLSLAQLISVLIMLVIPALLIAYIYKRKVLNFLNLLKAPDPIHLLLGAILILSSNFFLNYLMDLNAMIPLSEALTNKFEGLQEATTETQAFFLNFSGVTEFLIVFLTMAVAPALAEEMYFRGLLVGVLSDLKIGAFHVIFISSILFAMMHFQFYYLLPLLFMGALLGYVYYRTRNLWVSVFMHLLNNGLIVALTLSNKVELTQIDLEGNPPIYLSIIGIIAFIGTLYYFHKRTEETSLPNS